MRITGFTGGKEKPNTEKLVFYLKYSGFYPGHFTWGMSLVDFYAGRNEIPTFLKCKKLVIIIKTSHGEMKYKEVPIDDFVNSIKRQLASEGGAYDHFFTIEGYGEFRLLCEFGLGENGGSSLWIGYNGEQSLDSEEWKVENGEAYLLEGHWSEDGTYCDGTVAFLI